MRGQHRGAVAVFGALATVAMACGEDLGVGDGDSLTGSGTIVSETRDVADFTRIDLRRSGSRAAATAVPASSIGSISRRCARIPKRSSATAISPW